MSDVAIDQTPSAGTNTPSSSVFYRAIWKWHFFAALFVLPFMALLSVTGGIYLFDHQIEEIIYEERLNVTARGEALPLDQQMAAAMAVVPDAKRLRSIALSGSETRSTLVDVQDAQRGRHYVWVDPYSGEALASAERDSTLMRMVRKLHGELLLGDVGTKFVELAAHWTIVLMITGAYLWWPRGKRSLAKAVRPDFVGKQGRTYWKNMHRWTGMIALILVTPILITGLPWTDIWGGGLDRVQKMTGQSSPSRAFGGPPINSSASEGETLSPEQAILIATQQGVEYPIELRMPRGDDGVYFIRSRQDRPQDRFELHIDQYSGDVVNRTTWDDYPIVAALVSGGIAFHEGRLYGNLNLIQNLVAAIAGFVLAVSGFLAWWVRRPKGELGVPMVPETVQASWGLVALIVGLGVLFPLMGASLLIVLLIDWLVLSRMGWFQGASPSTA
ncbi:MAG: PepSY domain-containing protein [Pseudomonadota bacterium]